MNYLTDGCSHSKFVCLSFVAKCRDSLAQTSGRNAELSRQQLSFCMYYCLFSFVVKLNAAGCPEQTRNLLLRTRAASVRN